MFKNFCFAFYFLSLIDFYILKTIFFCKFLDKHFIKNFINLVNKFNFNFFFYLILEFY